MNREDSREVLERRYRRLLAWYPAGYRRVNEDEMLAVALAGAADGQHWPGLAETADLITSAVRKRLGDGLRNPVRQGTAGVLAVTGSILLAAVSMWAAITYPYGLLPVELPALTPAGLSVPGSAVLASIAAWWLLVAAAGMTRRRPAAAAGAFAGLAAELIVPALAMVPPTAVPIIQVTLSAVVAVAALASLGVRDRPLSWPAAAAITIAAAILPAMPAVLTVPLPGSRWWHEGALACTLTITTTAVGWVRPAVRRRVTVLLIPMIAAAAFSGGYFTTSFYHAQLLSPLMWLSQVLVIAVSAGLAGAALRKRTGRNAAREEPAR